MVLRGFGLAIATLLVVMNVVGVDAAKSKLLSANVSANGVPAQIRCQTEDRIYIFDGGSNDAVSYWNKSGHWVREANYRGLGRGVDCVIGFLNVPVGDMTLSHRIEALDDSGNVAGPASQYVFPLRPLVENGSLGVYTRLASMLPSNFHVYAVRAEFSQGNHTGDALPSSGSAQDTWVLTAGGKSAPFAVLIADFTFANGDRKESNVEIRLLSPASTVLSTQN